MARSAPVPRLRISSTAADGGELGRRAEAAPAGIEAGAQLGQGGPEQALAGEVRTGLGLGLGLAGQGRRQVAGIGLEFRALVAPGPDDPLEHLAEPGHAEAGRRREVGAAVEGLEPGGEPDAHGPAAAAGDGLHGAHVEIVQVRPLLPVDLDGDEMVVEHLGHRLILEGLALHDVAPVAGAVADAQEDGPVELAGFGQGQGAPGPPGDRVVGMLEQIGAAALAELVGWSLGHG